MADEQPHEDLYLVEHVREALATDPRTSVQGLEVARDGDAVVVTGTVTSAQRRDAVAQVATEVASPRPVINEVVVLAPPTDHETEELP